MDFYVSFNAAGEVLPRIDLEKKTVNRLPKNNTKKIIWKQSDQPKLFLLHAVLRYKIVN